MVWHWPPAIAQVRAKLVIVLIVCTLAFVATMGNVPYGFDLTGFTKEGEASIGFRTVQFLCGSSSFIGLAGSCFGDLAGRMRATNFFAS
jgi:hypothetical protein